MQISKFEASLVYKANSRPARAVIQKNPVLKSKTTNKNQRTVNDSWKLKTRIFEKVNKYAF